MVTVFKNFRKFSAEFSDFRISENFRKIDITDNWNVYFIISQLD